MRISPVLPATIAILLSACGLGEAEVSGSPIVATTTTTTTTIVVADEPIPGELAQADPAPSDDAPDTAVAGNSESTTTTTTAPTTTVPEITTTAAPATTAAPTTTTTTTTVVAQDATDAFCAVLGDVARLNPFQDGIDADADAYANFIRWEIDQLEMVSAPVEVSGDFASYVEAERRTLAWVAANGASLDDVRALGSELEATLDIEELADRVSRYFAFLRRECPQF